MTDVTPAFEDNPVATGFEIVESYTSTGFTKHRLKAGSATVDVAIIDIDEDKVDGYIDGRRSEMQHMSVDVPKPYKAEIETHDQEDPLEFAEEDGTVYGQGTADPEYNLLLEGMDQIARYDYLITWRYFPDKNVLAEIEVYLPAGTPVEEARELADALTFLEDS